MTRTLSLITICALFALTAAPALAQAGLIVA